MLIVKKLSIFCLEIKSKIIIVVLTIAKNHYFSYFKAVALN
ncbi:hypothetical protein RMAECT_1464 [Rickettsia rhipicephali str. Ect]|uniref:Uncharacterized protein n=1 Tax=Rickettsia rhipicephali str. Ect TaxID=1359199 RepID=A0A0F3PHP6_RICRH|nr:hypothetical protein RMAECT_1464 [Rickettsia rhipicephali str. Ect]